LPDYFTSAVEAASNDYVQGRTAFTATALCKPPRMLVLEQDPEIPPPDVADEVWKLLGSAMHKLMERGQLSLGDMREKRLYAEVDGVEISGQADLYVFAERKLVDFKFTKVYGAQHPHQEWKTQLDILAFIWKYNGFDVQAIENLIIMRDHSSFESKRGYPKCPVIVKPWTLASSEETLADIRKRIAERSCDPRPCTPEEMWQRGDGQRVRCELYCRANSVCGAFQEYKEYRSGKTVKVIDKPVKEVSVVAS